MQASTLKHAVLALRSPEDAENASLSRTSAVASSGPAMLRVLETMKDLEPCIQEVGMPTVPGASMQDLERYAILKTLAYTGGSTSRAADILKISRRKIQYRLREYSESWKGLACNASSSHSNIIREDTHP